MAKNAVLGHGGIMGTDPPSVRVATNKTITEKLCSDKFLESVLSPKYRARVISKVIKDPAYYRCILGSRSVRKHLSTKFRLKLWSRFLLGRLSHY